MKLLFDKAVKGEKLSFNDLDKIIHADFQNIWEAFTYSVKIKNAFHKEQVKLCSIINAKSGKCPENCAFCAQSKHHSTNIEIFTLISPENILKAAVEKEKAGSQRFSIVTSGTAVESEKDKYKVLKSVELIKKHTKLECCGSLGIINKNFMKQLRDAGMSGYHHNLETSESFFSSICTTHNYEEDLNTVKSAKELGFYVCSGGIFGLGENWGHRIEMAHTLKELNVDSVAINFLNPIKGTRLENNNLLPPLECLKIITLYRFILSDKDIRICGGREVNLKQLQPLVFPAGANGIMIGNYLTTKGRSIKDDFEMIKNLGLSVDEC